MASPMPRSLAALGICPEEYEVSGIQARHEPKVSQRNDGSWIVHCSECLRSPDGECPIGIGMPLNSRLTAERLKANHMSEPLAST
jgi:hypothetical protein